MTNGVNQSNPYQDDEQLMTVDPSVLGPAVDESAGFCGESEIDSEIVDAEIVPDSTEPHLTCEQTDPVENPPAQSNYQEDDGRRRRLNAIAPNTPRTPFAVKIHQTTNSEGKNTVLTAHVGVEDWSAMESRPVFDAIVVRKGKSEKGPVLAAGLTNHETGESIDLVQREPNTVPAHREISADYLLADLFVSAESVPSPVMVVRAMMRGPEEVRRLETPEERIERSADALVAGCCALCGECIEGEETDTPVDPVASNPPANAADQSATVASTDSTSASTDLTTTAPSSPVQSAAPAAETPVAVTAEQTRQAQEATGQTADTSPPPVRTGSTVVRATPSSSDGYSGEGPADSGIGYGVTASEVGAAYAAGIGSPRIVLSTGGIPVANAGSSGTVNRSVHGAPVAVHGVAPQVVYRRSDAIRVGDTRERDASAVETASLFPEVGRDTTIADVQLRNSGGVLPELRLLGDVSGSPFTGANTLTAVGAGRSGGRSTQRVGTDPKTLSPEILAALTRAMRDRAAADEARVIDPSEAASVVSPQAAFFAHQASGMASRPAQVDSREQDGVVARQDAELNTVSDPTQMGTQTGGQDARQGTSDPTLVASNAVEGDEVLEGELVDSDEDFVERWNPFGNAQVAADVIV